jgi:hypothetical protein
MSIQSFRPSYLVRRLAQRRFVSANPDAPWLVSAAITALHDLLKPSDLGYEFGSGRSTFWLARKVKFLHSREHSQNWFKKVQNRLNTEGLSHKVDYELVTAPYQDGPDDPDDHPYVQGIASLPPSSLDFVLVDGIMRMNCMRWAMKKLKPGGILILDNANVWFPNTYPEGPTTVVRARTSCSSKETEQVWTQISEWRGLVTTDGICDTRFWFAPPVA